MRVEYTSEEIGKPFIKLRNVLLIQFHLLVVYSDERGHRELSLPEMGAPTMEADPRNKISSPKALVSCDSPRS